MIVGFSSSSTASLFALFMLSTWKSNDNDCLVSAFAPSSSTASTSSSLNNIGSKWAYDVSGSVRQENFFYRGDPNQDPYVGDKWYYQPWGFIPQPQFFPLEKTGVDMWYFEPRTVIPPDDEFFHGYNSASHMWIPPEEFKQEFQPPPSQSFAAVPQLEAAAAEQGMVPPHFNMPQQQEQQFVQEQQPPPEQYMPEPVTVAAPAAPHQQYMPAQPMPEAAAAQQQMDTTMAAYDRAMSGK